MKFKKGDNVIVIAGKDRGKTGVIRDVLRAEGKIIIDGINLKKRHEKSRRTGKTTQAGQILDIASPLQASNVMILDPETNKPTRIGMKMEGNKKVRIAKKSGKTL